ncbi:MAG: hypothetical protein WA633_22810 [Stellaceae bacterium]
MSEERKSEEPEEARQTEAEEPPAAAAPVPAPRRSRAVAGWLAALVLVVIAGIASSPFWAPEIAPLLPWAAGSGTLAEEYTALATRVAAVEQRSAVPGSELDAIKSTQNSQARRVQEFETAVSAKLAALEKGPAASAADFDAQKSSLNELARRVDQLQQAAGDDRKIESAVAAARAELQQLEQRLAAVESQSGSQRASAAADLQEMRQQLANLDKGNTDLANRVGALERDVQSQNGTALRNDAMLALLLVQMREAVDQARPFEAEYKAFTTLARDPGLVAAVQPLAEAARDGVPSRAVLAKHLNELGAQIATASEPAAASDWGAQILARVRGLVTIRRINGQSQTGPEAAVSAAQGALGRGDLAAAAAALDTLTGPNAAAARPWLQMARDRLGVEGALNRLQELLTDRLSNNPAAAPTKAPKEQPDKSRTPS